MNDPQVYMLCQGGYGLPETGATLSTSVIDVEQSKERGRIITKSALRSLEEVSNADRTVKLGNRNLSSATREMRVAAAKNGDADLGTWRFAWGALQPMSYIQVYMRRQGDTGTDSSKFIILTHNAAPVWKITATMLPDVKVKSQFLTVFSGAGWLLPLKQVLELGVPIPPETFMEYETPELPTVFQFEQIKEGAEMPPLVQVKNAAGGGNLVIIPETARRRRLDLRRKR